MKTNILFSAIACGIALCQADGQKYYDQTLKQLNLVRGIIEEQMDHAAARGADEVKRAESVLKRTIKSTYDYYVAPLEKYYSSDGVKDMKKYYFETLEQEVKNLAHDKLYDLRRNAHPRAGREGKPHNHPAQTPPAKGSTSSHPTQAAPAPGHPSNRPAQAPTTQTIPAQSNTKRRVPKYRVDTIYYTEPL
ncbi:hypothetical protein DSO57_1005184 [Entomophthora muscae]|uniref:Uncharacterized protein n=2 Tax=Entomophthora muscae TaxID=34485 RepID=A0ACC2REZ5_9FUNG|nr:hypothetical protein DSO57_1032930 [Entomophthora muscae]KAJ9062945.1 hypothetical protein DSO57_1005184 [Entomophthora muscae]